MKKIIIVAGLSGLLLFSGTALADESHKDEHSGHGMTQVQPTAQTPAPAADDAHSHNMTNEEHQNMSSTTEHANMSSDEHANMSSDEHSSHSSGTDTQADSAGTHEEPASGGHGSHGSHENVVETPPNVPVLAAFGAINAAFILFGIWNKWFRKKEALV